MSKGRVRAKPVIGVTGAYLEPTSRNNQPFTRKLGAYAITTLSSGRGSGELSRNIFGIRRPALDDELLKGVREGDLAVRQLRPTIAHDCHSCTRFHLPSCQNHSTKYGAVILTTLR